MGKEERAQSYWNLPRGSQLATTGPGVVQPGCHSYRMGMMEGLSFILLFSVCCPLNTPCPSPVHTSFLLCNQLSVRFCQLLLSLIC